MKKIYINIFTIALILFCATANSQTVSTYENISLATDTFLNGSDRLGGFTSGNAFFVNHYDTTYSSWDGFAISDKRDTITGDWTNQYSAITGKGYNNSANYAVGYYNPFSPMRIKLNGAAKGKQLSGFYITNSTYGYLAMKNGIAGVNKKFGGTTGNDKDWFKLSVKGYKNGNFSDSTVDFYLADFRFSDSTKNYFVKQWTWFNLSKLGNVDSIEFTMSSSDTGTYGMNNPAYFCMDNFTTRDLFTGIVDVNKTQISFTIYPNPAKDFIVIEGENAQSEISIFDLTGRELLKQNFMNGEKISVESFSKGIYFIVIKTENKIQTKKLIIE